MRLAGMLLVLTLVGCAAPNTFFTHPHQDEALYWREQKECNYEALKYTQTVDPRFGDMFGVADMNARRRNLMIACMESKGYTRCARNEVPAGEATIR